MSIMHPQACVISPGSSQFAKYTTLLKKNLQGVTVYIGLNITKLQEWFSCFPAFFFNFKAHLTGLTLPLAIAFKKCRMATSISHCISHLGGSKITYLRKSVF